MSYAVWSLFMDTDKYSTCASILGVLYDYVPWHICFFGPEGELKGVARAHAYSVSTKGALI
jgi:hypothetical protein